MSQQPNMEEILVDYLDGTLDAKRRQAVETLLKHDAKLRKALAAMREVRGVLRDLPLEPMPAGAADSLQRELRPPVEPPIPLYSSRWLIRLAAAVAIAVSVGLVIWASLPAPMDQRTVAMDSVAAPALHNVALNTKKDSDVTRLGDTMEPTLATRAGPGAEPMRASGAASENEPTLVVVVASDIGGTEREIRNLLTLNNINYEAVPASDAERDEVAKEMPTRGGQVADAAPVAAAPALAKDRAEKVEMEAKAGPPANPAPSAPAAAAPPAIAQSPAPSAKPAAPTAAPAPLAQSDMAGGVGGGGAGLARGAQREPAQASAGAKPTAQASGAAAQRRSQAAGRTAPERYGMVVARNVTPDQLGRIRSGLRDASRTGNMRVVDAPAGGFSQTAADNKQALNRAEQTDNYQQLQRQNAWQYSNSQAIQNAPTPQELASQTQNGPQRPISYSARYDVTIVVQGEAPANAGVVVPTQLAPTTVPTATAPSTTPTVP